MRKLIESTFVTMDGVINSPEKWGAPYWNDEHHGYSSELIFAADALLLGRVTYEGFAQAWPSRKGDEFSDRINSMPKYVASRTLKGAGWNATVLKGDVAEEVTKLKEQAGQSILKYGTGELDRALFEHRLVDEYHFWLFPGFVGRGDRLFERFDTTHLRLLRTTKFSTGIVVLVYQSNGAA